MQQKRYTDAITQKWHHIAALTVVSLSRSEISRATSQRDLLCWRPSGQRGLASLRFFSSSNGITLIISGDDVCIARVKRVPAWSGTQRDSKSVRHFLIGSWPQTSKKTHSWKEKGTEMGSVMVWQRLLMRILWCDKKKREGRKALSAFCFLHAWKMEREKHEVKCVADSSHYR